MSAKSRRRNRYGIFTGSIEGVSFPVLDRKGTPLTCSSERDAERMVARICVNRIQRFLRGELSFEEAMQMPEFYLRVDSCSAQT